MPIRWLAAGWLAKGDRYEACMGASDATCFCSLHGGRQEPSCCPEAGIEAQLPHVSVPVDANQLSLLQAIFTCNETIAGSSLSTFTAVSTILQGIFSHPLHPSHPRRGHVEATKPAPYMFTVNKLEGKDRHEVEPSEVPIRLKDTSAMMITPSRSKC
ncbi:hypothetical protein GQ53DRAFT_775557 [Thozetella sp. PMI_491]|nr:hypothetical protein GQ53DRAFT_775557 [Thozetella sp. PMI_491]